VELLRREFPEGSKVRVDFDGDEFTFERVNEPAAAD
jgi:hypothetical protein